MTSFVTGAGGGPVSVLSPVYDVFGRLVSMGLTNYRYNGLGYLIMYQFDADEDEAMEDAERYYLCYDERWRVVATYRNQDDDPKDLFVYHAAGARGFGGSSYIDAVALRDSDGEAWTAEGGATLTERRYYCQNWRADVCVVLNTLGDWLERVQ